MKIGVDITVLYRARAGVLNYHLRLLRAMIAQQPGRHQFELVNYLPLHNGLPPRDVELPQAPHVQVHHVRGVRHRKLGHLGFLQRPGVETVVGAIDNALDPAWHMVTTQVMAAQLQRHLRDVDVFHSSDLLNHAIPGAKNVTTIFDLTARLFPEYHTPQVKSMQAEKYRFAREQADAVIAISENTKRDVVRLLGIEAERVHVVYGGVDAAYRPLPETAVRQTLTPYNLEPDTYILHVGTLEPRKNLTRLVEAYHSLTRKLSGTVPRLVLVGGKGWLYDALYGRVQTLDLQDHVLFLNNVPNHQLPAFYNGARLFVYPSLYEGLGLPPLEAMACGAPVLTANSSSLPEVVGDAGLMVDPYDTEALAEKMHYLLTHEAEQERLRRGGPARAAQFNWQRAAQETLNVYGEN